MSGKMISGQDDCQFVAFHPFLANKSPNKGINQYSLRYAPAHAHSAILEKRHQRSGGATRTAAILAALLPYRSHLGGPAPVPQPSWRPCSRTAAILAARCRTAAILAARCRTAAILAALLPYRSHLGGPLSYRCHLGGHVAEQADPKKNN